MILVDQTLYGDGTSGNPQGDCFRACFASILEVTIEDVPHFAMGMPVEDPDDLHAVPRHFFGHINRWLSPRGLAYFEVRYEGGAPGWVWHLIPPEGFWVAVGPGYHPAELDHAVVMFGRDLAHDPSPAKKGLRSIHTVGVFVPLDPARVARRPTVEE